jgi:adenylate cyclase
MADIFISYSSSDREKAEQLTELLSSAGLSVWIDQDGIGAATSWSKEIVDAIDECKALIVMLSPSSVTSANVAKEISLAAERKKKILPLDLEPVALPNEIAYHLTGLQRSSMTNIDSVIRSLSKLGLEAMKAPELKIVKETDSRKSLMILPFEDLSPTGDNGWFSDGIANELISALSHVKALRVADQQATKDYKRYTGTLPVYAKEMAIRYFVQGDVRKFGDQIKISARLLDIETGEHLWQDFLRGEMKDVFDIQEQVAAKVVEGLNVILTSEEKKKLAERGTDNEEAYALYLKSDEYFGRQTREGFRLAIEVLTKAIELDPRYAKAMQDKAYVLSELFRVYDRRPEFLTEAEVLSKRGLELKPDLHSMFGALSNIYRIQGKPMEAEEAAREYLRRAPEHYASHFGLGFFYADLKQFARAIPHYEKAIEIKPDRIPTNWNLVLASKGAHDTERMTKWSRAALPIYERRLRLAPDDEGARAQYANLLEFAGERERALSAIKPLAGKQDLDGFSLYNIACLYARLGESVQALNCLRRSVTAGFSSIETFRHDPDLDPLRGIPEFEELMKELEEKIAQEKTDG